MAVGWAAVAAAEEAGTEVTGTAEAGTEVAGTAVVVAATVGRGVSRSIETVGGAAASGRVPTLSAGQTAARSPSGAITAETGVSLVTDPSVWPVPLGTVQLPSRAVQLAVPLLMS